MSKIILILVSLITLAGGFLRFYKITENPPSLNIDEVSYGYTAFSILNTGKDEYGKFMPISFKSIGDYKSPVLIYSLVPSIAVFGLNEFGVRFTTALAGVLSIPIFFLLLQALLKRKKVAVIGAGLLAVSPWHVYYSRYASESLISTFLLMLGIWFFLKMFDGGKVWATGAAVFLALSIYTYHSQRFFVPVFVLSIILMKYKLFKRRGNILFFLVPAVLIVSPLVISILFGPANTREKAVFLSLDIDYTRYVILDHIIRGGENLLLFFFWLKRYMNYLQPDFLFSTGMNMTLSKITGVGILYFYEIPWLILGIVKLIKNRTPEKSIIVLWILLGILPASLANNEQSGVRSLLVLPALLTIVAIGAESFILFVNSIKKSYIKTGITFAYSFFIVVVLTNAFLIFTVHFPRQKGEDFMEGTKEAVEYVLLHKDQYKEIVFDPYRGVGSPSIVSVPHMYVLFYSKYDPLKYQTGQKIAVRNSFGFDKFIFRKIDWEKDRLKKNTLFIGSPWSFPENGLKDKQLLKKVEMTSKDIAFYIVSPK